MTYVRSFADFYPPKRYDGLPFTQAVIEESEDEAAGYGAIDTIALDPLDSDPSDPQGRDFTTTKAVLETGWYRIVWEDATGGAFNSDPIYFTSPNTAYATTAELRKKLGVTADILPDAEAAELIAAAEDLIDDRLGNRPVDPDTGRKVVPAEEEDWRLQKLAGATLEVAANLYRDPGVESRQRVRSVSGDIATSGPYGPAYGERAEALLSASGLAVKFARAGRRRTRNERLAQTFSESNR